MNEKQIKEAMMKELVTDALEVDCSTDIPDFWDCLADHLIRKGWRKECPMDNQAKATKRPWTTDGATTDNQKDLVLVASFDLVEGIAQCFKAEDASLIVKAVNNHEALLEALKNYTLCDTSKEVKPMRACLVDAMSLISKIELNEQ